MGPEVAAASIAAGGGLASGLASGLMQPDPPKPQQRKLSMPNTGPSPVSAKSGGGALYSGRPEISGPHPRTSLASEMLQGGYR